MTHLEVTRKGKRFVCECAKQLDCSRSDNINLGVKGCYHGKNIAGSLLKPGKAIRCYKGTVFCYAGELCEIDGKRTEEERHYFVEIV